MCLSISFVSIDSTKAMVAALLSQEKTVLTNVPDIGDVAITGEMLSSIGVRLEFDKQRSCMIIDPSGINTHEVQTPHTGSNRLPILLISPLLHRFGKASVPILGGCNIGSRLIDFHLNAIRTFGNIVEESESGFSALRTSSFSGTEIKLPYPSVGATETCLLLAVLATGTTIISNAAVEPEIFELITMLRTMGALIFTFPDRRLVIEGVKQLNGTQINILGDRIEAASWACLACASDGNIAVEGIRPETLGNFLTFFKKIGGGFKLRDENVIEFFRQSELKPVMVETDVFPGFSTDWQQPFAILLTQAHGVSIIHETVYERRFGYLETLNKLGAQVQLTTYCLGNTPCRFRDKGHKHSAIITGPAHLTATDFIEVPDLRAGLAYIIAVAIAKGTTTIKNVSYIERGYGNLEKRASELTLNIERYEKPADPHF